MNVECVAKAKFPTKFGEFELYAFRDASKKEHLALTHGKLNKENIVNVRVHSKCLTGDTFASLRCDCRAQFESALAYLAKHGGILVYLDQEGRGIGLANKVKAYALQDQGLDTVEANRRLGFADDLRDYSVAAKIIEALGIRSIRLLTNNPNKLHGLEDNGLKIVERIPLITTPTSYNKNYIETKKKKMNHLI